MQIDKKDLRRTTSQFNEEVENVSSNEARRGKYYNRLNSTLREIRLKTKRIVSQEEKREEENRQIEQDLQDV